MNTAVEWKDVLIESIKGAFILALLERFYVTRANSWFEDHIGARDCWACATLHPVADFSACRLLLLAEPAVQPHNHECVPAGALAVEAYETHQHRLKMLL